MPELIDRDALKNHLYRAQAEAFKCGIWYVAGAIQSFVCILDKHPTIEAEHVRHGRWIKIEPSGTQFRRKCSECGGIVHAVSDFCPYCGAKMDGKDINVITKYGGADND